MEKYVIASFVGEGSFGRVFKAKHRDTGAVVALKVIRKKGRSPKDLKSLRQECDIQRQLKHPNIIRMIESFDTDSELVVATEFVEKELHSVLSKEGCLGETQAKAITWDLVSALYYLHSHRVLHRDLKPQNVLIDSSGHAKLCDFGLARSMTIATHVLISMKGTPLYMAPELIDEKPYDHQADLWSLGCIVYELMAGQPPFCTVSIVQLFRMIRHKPVPWPSFISSEAFSFLQGLLHKDPAKRMPWPDILKHPFVAGHVLILPEDIKTDSPFTQPLSHSQLEAKQRQREKLTSSTTHRAQSQAVKVLDRREQDVFGHGRVAIQGMECVPMSDDDSVRATSAFSVRDSLKTDDEEHCQPLTAANAKLLTHEYKVLNQSNLVVCNLENNMAQLMVAPCKNNDKMDEIVEESTVNHVSDDKAKSKNPQPEIAMEPQNPSKTKTKNKSKDHNSETSSHSMENPKSSTKSGSDVSSGLSKSVPPSYKQKILQFSRDKFRFGSGGNKLTRSLKRSFHFSRSWEKFKNERRTSEPSLEFAHVSDADNEIGPKEVKDEDSEKCDIIEEITDEKDCANNDIKVNFSYESDEEAIVAATEPSAMEQEEWEAFLNSNISEVMDGDVESLTQLNMVSMVVGVVAGAGRCGRVCGAVAALLALPAVSPTLPRHTLLHIQDVYLEAKVVHNFVFAINTLMKDVNGADADIDERVSGVGRMLEVCAWLCVRSCRAVRQLAAALAAHKAHAVFSLLLTHYEKSPRIVLNIVGILITILQDLPEHAAAVERVLFHPDCDFPSLLRQPSDALRMRLCILVCLLCNFCCSAFSGAMEKRWSSRDRECLEDLQTHCNVTLNRAARLAIKELTHMAFYSAG